MALKFVRNESEVLWRPVVGRNQSTQRPNLLASQLAAELMIRIREMEEHKYNFLQVILLSCQLFGFLFLLCV